MIPLTVPKDAEGWETVTAEQFDAWFGPGWRREIDDVWALCSAAQSDADAGEADEAFDSVATAK